MCESQPTPPHPNLPASSIVTLSQSPRVHALEVAGQISLEVSVCPWYHTPVSALGSVRDRHVSLPCHEMRLQETGSLQQ